MRTATGGFGMAIFGVAAFLTPWSALADWPTPGWFLVIDVLALAAWGQAVKASSGLSWRRTSEWLGALILTIAVLLFGLLLSRLAAQVLVQGIVGVLGYVLVIVALFWIFGWVMSDDRRARAFLALRRVMLGRASTDDVRILEAGPATYR